MAASVGEQLLMNTEEVGVLFSKTLNGSSNQTIRTTNNIGTECSVHLTVKLHYYFVINMYIEICIMAALFYLSVPQIALHSKMLLVLQ